MTAVSDQASGTRPEKRRRSSWLFVHEMWASLAIAVMWLAVLFDAVFGPDIVSANAGAQMTRIPSAVVLALFAYLGTRVVARYGFSRRDDPGSTA